MSQDEQDKITGRIVREAKEAKREFSLVEAKLQGVISGIKALVEDLPKIRANQLNYRHANLGTFINLEAIEALLEQRDEALRKAQELEERVKSL